MKFLTTTLIERSYNQLCGSLFQKINVFNHFLNYICGSDGKESACNAADPGSIPGSGRSPGEGNGTPLQYSCLGNPMDRGAWHSAVHGVTKNRKWLKWLSTIALQYCVGFCHISAWISCRYTYISSLALQPSSHLSRNPNLLGCHRALDLSSLSHTMGLHWLSNFPYGNACFKATLLVCPMSLPVPATLFLLPESPLLPCI